MGEDEFIRGNKDYKDEFNRNWKQDYCAGGGSGNYMALEMIVGLDILIAKFVKGIRF